MRAYSVGFYNVACVFMPAMHDRVTQPSAITDRRPTQRADAAACATAISRSTADFYGARISSVGTPWTNLEWARP